MTTINPIHSNNTVEFSQYPATAPKYTLSDNGELRLSSGQAFYIRDITIHGQKQTIQKPLTPEQKAAIDNLIATAFAHLDEAQLNASNINQIKINSTIDQKGEVEIKRYDQKVETHQINEQVSKLFDKVVNSFDPDLSTRNINHKTRPNLVETKTARTIQHLPNPAASLESPAVLQGNTSPSEVAAGTDKGILEYEYEFEGAKLGKQTVVRQDTLETELGFLDNQIKHLKSAKNLSTDPNEKSKLESKINFYEKQRDNINQLLKADPNKTWLNSSYFRDLINASDSFEEAVEKYINSAVNMRYQEFKGADGVTKAGFMRVGVISDMSNGWVSLADLKKMKTDPELIKAKIQDLEKQASSKLNEKQSQSIKHAIQMLKIAAATEGAHVNVLDQLIEQREMKLQQQMMRLVEGQIANNPEKIKAGTFEMVHVGLLNQAKHELDATGWMHDERVEMEDMNEIFKSFYDKPIVFDSSGPYIGEDGQLHLPPPEAMKNELEGQVISLKTYFFNTSVQGNTDNTHTQKQINIDSAVKYLKDHPELTDSDGIRQALDSCLISQKSNYEQAENLIYSFLEESNAATSFGCLSAKDRTGFVGERLMHRYLENEEARAHFNQKIFDREAVPTQIVLENTPNYPALKVDPSANLPKGTSKIEIVKKLARAELGK